jgi:hypothetical protein
MIKQILFTLLIVTLIVTQISIAQNYGVLRLTNYADDRQSAFSFTFDDGLKSQFDYAKPVLDQFGFKGTFYVLPPYLAENNQELIWRYGTWGEFESLANERHEIGSHTMNHDTLTLLPLGNVSTEGTLLYELYQSQIFIEQKIPSKKCISFNYPYTIHNSVVDSATKLFYENGRSLGESPNNPDLTGNQWYGLKAEVVEFDNQRNSVDDDLDELYSFLEWTKNSIDNNKWGMIIIHDVVPFTQIDSLISLPDPVYEPVSTEWLTSLCDFLWQKSANKDVWIETVGNITRYIKERENATYQIISSSDQLIEINLSDSLNNEIYNYPLSAYISIPVNWNYVRTEQNGKVDTLTTTLTDSGRVVLVNVIPDNGNLKITPIKATVVENEISNVEGFQLYQNYPNPFNPSTKISWQSPIGSWQTLKVYDALGNEVATLLNEYKPAGTYEVEFNVAQESIPAIASGIYFYQLKSGNFIQTKKMLYLK